MKKKRLLSWFLALVMVLGLLPVSAMAAEKDVVYISASHDGKYLEADDGGYIAYAPVELEELEKIDLAEYGLADYQYEDHITVLHLLIYAHETLYGEEWEDVRVSGGAGSIYFESGLFGMDNNANYYFNGEYPADESGWGYTADRIVLNKGDFVDYAHYSSWSFWMDSAAGFHYFMDGSKITHEYKVAAGETLTVALGCTSGGMGGETVLNPETDYPVSYGSALFADDAEKVSTDGNGEIELSFVAEGTYYLWAEGSYGDFGDIVSSPTYAKVTVTAGETADGDNTGDENTGGDNTGDENTGGDNTGDETTDVQEPEGIYSDWQEVMPKTEKYLLDLAKDTAPIVNSTYGEWLVLGLARNGVDANSDFFDDYYQNVVSYVKENIDENGRLHSYKSTDNARVILALTALGYDVTNVGGHNLLKGLSDQSYVTKQGINGPVWALIALDSGNYDIPVNADSSNQVTCEWLVDYILEKQITDGGWGLDDTPDDMTPMAVQALAPYYNSDSAVKQAVDKAIGIMDEMLQNVPSPETSAQIIVALSALEKDSSAAMEQMLKYSLEDGSFAHEQGTNQMATEQAFYALVAYDRFQKGENILYDMSDVEKQTSIPEEPSEGGSNTSGGGASADKKTEKIEVTFRLIGDGQHEDGVKGHEAYVTWIPTETYTMEEGDTMYDVFVEAIADHGLQQKGAENDYVESIKAPKCLGGYWLGEFDNGQNSGWMYTVDGDHPDMGLTYYELEDGDEIIWHYVDDYTKEERNSSSEYYYRWMEAEDIDPEDYAEELEEEAEEVPVEEELAEEEVPETEETLPVAVSFSDIAESDWFYKDVVFAVEKGLFSGTGEGKFSPNASMNRAMLVTVLYRLADAGEFSGFSDFADVPADQWYHDAVMWAAENGIVHGYDNGRFGSMDSITREQMATILFRYAAYMGYDTDAANSLASYRDSGSISPFAQKPLQWANGAGLISGRTADTLDPLGSVTRAEVASILHRFVKNVA